MRVPFFRDVRSQIYISIYIFITDADKMADFFFSFFFLSLSNGRLRFRQIRINYFTGFLVETLTPPTDRHVDDNLPLIKK